MNNYEGIIAYFGKRCIIGYHYYAYVESIDKELGEVAFLVPGRINVESCFYPPDASGYLTHIINLNKLPSEMRDNILVSLNSKDSDDRALAIEILKNYECIIE